MSTRNPKRTPLKLIISWFKKGADPVGGKIDDDSPDARSRAGSLTERMDEAQAKVDRHDIHLELHANTLDSHCDRLDSHDEAIGKLAEDIRILKNRVLFDAVAAYDPTGQTDGDYHDPLGARLSSTADNSR